LGEVCAGDEDCKSGHCPFDLAYRVCSAGALGDPCGNAADCESTFCAPPSKFPTKAAAVCTTGEVGASCLNAADCKSGLCAPAAEDSPFLFVCAE